MSFKDYFSGKGCVVTGAASGIGFAVSEALLRSGAIVFMADRDTKGLASAVERLDVYAERVRAVTVDVTNQDQVQRLIEDAASQHGRLDYLFNNAGVGATMPIGTATLEHWRRLIDLNLWGVIYGIYFAIPVMRRQGGGHIVTTSSVAGLIPLPYQSLYCTTKYAVAGLSESLRFELADEGIYFSVVCPGDVATAIYGKSIMGEVKETKPPDNAIPAEEAAQAILAGVANKEGIIVLPEFCRTHWRNYWADPESIETALLDMARQRKKAFESKGFYF